MTIVITKNNIPRIVSFVNMIMADVENMLVKLGVTNATANQAAEKFPVTDERALKNAHFVFVMSLL